MSFEEFVENNKAIVFYNTYVIMFTLLATVLFGVRSFFGPSRKRIVFSWFIFPWIMIITFILNYYLTKFICKLFGDVDVDDIVIFIFSTTIYVPFLLLIYSIHRKKIQIYYAIHIILYTIVDISGMLGLNVSEQVNRSFLKYFIGSCMMAIVSAALYLFQLHAIKYVFEEEPEDVKK